jgi:hypothetical protein
MAAPPTHFTFGQKLLHHRHRLRLVVDKLKAASPVGQIYCMRLCVVSVWTSEAFA